MRFRLTALATCVVIGGALLPASAASTGRAGAKARGSAPTRAVTPQLPSLEPARARPAGDASSRLPWERYVLGALCAGVIVGASRAVLWARRRRRTPLVDEVEAELQEIIAEERARRHPHSPASER